MAEHDGCDDPDHRRRFRDGLQLAGEVAVLVNLRCYQDLREKIIEMGYGEEVAWAQALEGPVSAEDLWREYAWVVINAGMKNQIAQKIWDKVRPVVEGGGSAHNVFGHKAKAEAIDVGWAYRDLRFVELSRMRGDPTCSINTVLAWCEELPWVGPVTSFHLAKNLGFDIAKPDRWLVRVALAAAEPVQALCERLSRESGDRVATVDLVIWRACNLGLWP